MRRAISDPTAGERARKIGPDPRPLGHVFGHRRGDPLPPVNPHAPVLRLRGFRPVWRGK